ncbi:MAG: 23S rRNA (uracil(1939)-C(5))-methyltransferase RlmD [Clostridia bacterium]|nr:23S rRNA (uracil(1939)-C(5))-methyltransferase RlmD [Clostridia bacterium]
MLKEKEIYTVTITANTETGDGVCRIDDFAVFVAGAAAGDTLEIEITKVKKSYAFARILRIVTPSIHRVEPFCKAFPKCGGCQLAHLSYSYQLEMKQQIVTDALRRLGHLDLSDAEVFPTLGMDEPQRYRNKMVFPIGYKADGRLVGGFYAAKSHHIIALSDCALGAQAASEMLSAVVRYMKENKVSAYDETTHKGLVRRLFVRTGTHSGEMMAVISVNGTRLPEEKKLVEALCSVQSDFTLSSIVLNSNTEKNNLVLGAKNRTLYGKATISDTLSGLSFDISPNSFYQVNPQQTERLYETAVRFAGLTGAETVLDLYCGIGTISLCAAKSAARVIGVEIVAQAIADAKENAARNHIKNAEFYTGSAEDISEKLLSEGLSPNVIFIDPPRKGSDEKTLSAMLSMRPEKIVYVSCNPATLARDASILTAGGYQIKKVQPVDMFPHTGHVEAVVLLQQLSLPCGK